MSDKDAWQAAQLLMYWRGTRRLPDYLLSCELARPEQMGIVLVNVCGSEKIGSTKDLPLVGPKRIKSFYSFYSLAKLGEVSLPGDLGTRESITSSTRSLPRGRRDEN